MTTNEFVSMIAEEVGAAWTRQRILEFTNRAQNEILAEDNEISRVKPDPFIATANTTYSYGAAASLYDSTTGAQGALVGDVRTVREVYSFSNSVSIFDFQTLDPSSDKPNQVEYNPFRKDKVKARVSCIESKVPGAGDCVLKWWEGNNPGATTIVWRARAFLWPAQLTSENVALTLPADLHDTFLMYAVLKRLERREFGNPSQMLQLYRVEYENFRRKYMVSIDQDTLGFCQPRII